ncbi:MAG: hypothetical protein AB4426_18170 [Xenococcaceae cyanobacterium]
MTASPDITRGGDGGSMICGGAGFFVGWLTLSTAYFFDEACKRDPNSINLIKVSEGVILEL